MDAIAQLQRVMAVLRARFACCMACLSFVVQMGSLLGHQGIAESPEKKVETVKMHNATLFAEKIKGKGHYKSGDKPKPSRAKFVGSYAPKYPKSC